MIYGTVLIGAFVLDVRGSVARARAAWAARTAILLNARGAQAGQAVLLERALPRPGV
jgi:hypothetical protein